MTRSGSGVGHGLPSPTGSIFPNVTRLLAKFHRQGECRRGPPAGRSVESVVWPTPWCV